MNGNWCLVLTLWGQKYSAAHVNALSRTALKYSPTCSDIILLTDRHREGVDPRVTQKRIPAFFDRAEFRRGGYPIKLSLFSRAALPKGMRCVYLDLDTVVTGDLGRIAALVRKPDDIFMLPPGNLIGFGRLRRLLFRLTDGRKMAVGNSSILAFHSGAEPNLCDVFERLHDKGSVARPRLFGNDDRFISWFAQTRLRPIPASLGVMFRREFLAWPRLYGRVRNRLPWVKARRAGIVAVTFNGTEHKLESLLALPDGAQHHDKRGRVGWWSDKEMGPLKARIAEAARALTDSAGS